MSETDNKASGLSMLYPYLDGPAPENESDDCLLDSVVGKAKDSVNAKQQFFAENASALVAMARCIADIYRSGGKMFSMGNGGSACDAAHFAVEFQHPITVGRPALPVTNLCADTTLITALGNDIGMDQIFARQLAHQASEGDGLMGFSTSGNSKNLLAAYSQAARMKVHAMAMTGGSGGAIADDQNVEHCLCVESDSVHRVQEIQLTAYHILWDLVHTLLGSDIEGQS